MGFPQLAAEYRVGVDGVSLSLRLRITYSLVISLCVSAAEDGPAVLGRAQLNHCNRAALNGNSHAQNLFFFCSLVLVYEEALNPQRSC